MIKSEFKTRFTKEPSSTNQKSSHSHTSKSTSNKKLTPSNKTKNYDPQSNNKKKSSNYMKYHLKENKPVNQNTPKRIKIYRGDFNMSDQRLEEIKFISKECSSIKENHNQCISFSNSGNNLDQFSPLFDRIEKDNSKADFTLQIYAIEDLESFYQIKNPIEYSNQKRVCHNGNSSNGKSGRIKKNKVLTTISSDYSKNTQINTFILQIFKALDHQSNHILSKQNCCSQKLTTELNYLIGSILNKIKVKGKQYDYEQFENQFKSLIDDSQLDQILQILNNQRKRIKTNQSLQTQHHQEITIQIQDIPLKKQKQSPISRKSTVKEQGVAQKLNKISNKLNLYLAKNQLENRNTECKQVKQPINEQKGIQLQKRNEKQNSFHSTKQPHNIKNSDLRTTATQNSKVSEPHQSIINSQAKIKGNVQLIKRTDGSVFELYFSELNKHLD